MSFSALARSVCCRRAAGRMCTGSSGPATFYLLRCHGGRYPGAAISTTAGDARDISILVGPITLPDYLDRTQIVTVAGKHVLALDEFSRWAESLQEGFYRVLLEDLSSLLNTPEVYAHDRSGSISADYQVVIDVTRFDSVQGEEALLTAFWTESAERTAAPQASGVNPLFFFRFQPVVFPG